MARNGSPKAPGSCRTSARRKEVVDGGSAKAGAYSGPVDALDQKIQIAVPVGATAGSGLWDPLPVTLPTYVSKPAATRRTVQTIDLESTGVWSSGRSESDSALAREAEARGWDREVAWPWEGVAAAWRALLDSPDAWLAASRASWTAGSTGGLLRSCSSFRCLASAAWETRSWKVKFW